MQELIARTLAAAHANQGPVEVNLPNGCWLSACPEANDLLICVGLQNPGPVTMRDVLQQRAQAPQKWGHWWPGLLNDDRLILIKKVPLQSSEPFAPEWLEQAQELLT